MPALSVWMVRAALLHLGAGFTLGALMLWQKGLPFDPQVWRWREAHIDMLLLGWTLQLAMGVAFWIMPRFSTPPRHGDVRPAVAAALLLNVGVLLSAAGGWAGDQPWLVLSGRALVLLAVLLFVLHIWPRVRPPGLFPSPFNRSSEETQEKKES